MSPIDDATLLSVLHDSNPWWRTATVPKEMAPKFKRRDFHFIRKNLMDDRSIIALIGPRQVGKTTLIYQLIEELIAKGIDPKRTLFMAVDNPRADIKSDEGFNRIIEMYFNKVLKEPMSTIQDRVFIFLDEVTKFDEWADQLKGYQDMKRPIKFFITDSSSSRISRGASESLIGRVTIQRMMTMKFLDCLLYREPKVDLNKLNWDLRRAFQSAINGKGPGTLFRGLETAMDELAPIDNQVRIHFNEYLLKDGYPELLSIHSLDRCRTRLQDYLSLTLYKDVIRMFEVRHPAVLEDLLTMMADCTAQLVEFSNLSANLSIKQDTLRNYLQYLEDIYLVTLNEFYSRNRSLRIRKNRKGYVSNTAILNNILGQLDDSLFEDKSRVGRVVETLIMEHTKRLNYILYPGKEPRLFYWRDRRGHEVDIVMDTPKGPVPIEVKFRNKIDDEDHTGIEAFNREHKSPLSLIVTENLLRLDDRTVLVPARLFLILC